MLLGCHEQARWIEVEEASTYGHAATHAIIKSLHCRTLCGATRVSECRLHATRLSRRKLHERVRADEL